MLPKYLCTALFLLAALPALAQAQVPIKAPPPAQAPASTQPAENPNAPYVFGSGSAAPLAPMPPHLPKYMPSGADNLDYDWIEDGGARLYWNDVIIPQQLRMNGAYWIDPALVPQLLPDKSTPRRRYYPRKKRRVKSTAPVNASSTALKTPAIPLPVTKEKAPAAKPATTDKAKENVIPPLRAPQKSPAPASSHMAPPVEDITVVPPPLQ